MPESENPRSAAEYARLQDVYGGKFVATRNGEVVASGDTNAEMLRELKEKGLDGQGLLFRFVWAKDTIYVL